MLNIIHNELQTHREKINVFSSTQHKLSFHVQKWDTL